MREDILIGIDVDDYRNALLEFADAWKAHKQCRMIYGDGDVRTKATVKLMDGAEDIAEALLRREAVHAIS